MKTRSLLMIIVVFMYAWVSLAFGAGIDQNGNLSAEYTRLLNRNAATDAADAANYNPAGLVKLQDGFYVNFSTQYITKEYSHELSGASIPSLNREYKQDEPSPVYPDLYMVYKKGDWAGFFNITVPAGGGTVDYKDGSASTAAVFAGMYAGLVGSLGAVFSNLDMSLEVTQTYWAGTLGGSYAVNEMISVAAGFRVISASKQTILENSWTQSVPVVAKVDATETAKGYAGIFSLDISPVKDLVIAARYEMKTRLEFETEVDKKYATVNGTLNPTLTAGLDSVAIDGAKERRDLPALLGMGVSYMIMPGLRAEADFTYYFNKDAAWNGSQRNYENNWDAGFALEYAVLENFKVSAGYIYTWTGAEDDNRGAPENPELDAHAVAGGAAIEILPGLIANLGVVKVFYKEDTVDASIPGAENKLMKDSWDIGLGIQYRFL